ncbi:hypothetical protein [Kitasatospora sp. NPDC057223]|uniref:hypothetical protein n=1 Tax=Kitasatospora sp. NPDC057223 TaxID=3346055 RepID=UPI0036359CE0
MTVLHSTNADVADVSNLDEAPAQDGTTETDPRADLGRYAELGAFTLTADTHAWYGAVDTVATPEDARAASTVLAELRGRDLQQTWQAVTDLAGEAGVDEPGTVARAALLVELLQRVHRTYATLDGAAYDADLDALAAATAGGAWRKERGVKLSWIRAMGLRKQAQTLAVARRLRRDELHEALAAAEVERRTWAVFAPEGTRPVPPADGELVDATAQAVEAINAGLVELARLLPGRDLEALTFQELTDLVERLADDEGTLYRLPTLRTLRAGLEEAGLTELLTELADARADRRAAEAAYQRHTGGADAARQALAGGQRDGQTEVQTEAQTEAQTEVQDDQQVVEQAVEQDVTEDVVEDITAADETTVVETAAVEAEAVVSIPAPVTEDENLAAAETAVELEAEVPAEPEAETAVAEAEPVEAVAVAEAVAPVVEPEPVAAVEPEVVEPEAVVVEVAAVVEPAVVEPEPVAVVEPEVAAVVEVVEPAVVVPEVVAVEEKAAPAPVAAAARSRRPKKPDFTPGKPVAAYSAEELLAVVRWIDADSVKRTDEELLRAAMKEFGFGRLGPRIKEALGTAIAQARG